MRGAAGLDQLVTRQRLLASLQPFLQAGLGILGHRPRTQLVEQRQVEPGNRLLGGFEAGVEIDGADQRLQRIGENRRTLGTAAFQLAFAQA